MFEYISGVLEAYRACIRQVQLYGPTNFSPVINHVGRFAASYRDGSSYFILLILTDGIITDMPQTVQVSSTYAVQEFYKSPKIVDRDWFDLFFDPVGNLKRSLVYHL